MTAARFASIGFALLLVPACTRPSGTSQVTVGLTAVRQPSAAALAATQATALMVTVTRVDVHLAGDDADVIPPVKPISKDDHPAEGGDHPGDDSRWLTVFSGQASINLVDAAATEAFLGTATVPAGRITQIRLLLADDATLVAGGVSLPVTCPSCTETGVKVVIGDADDLATVVGGHLHVVLDIDLSVSLIVDSNGISLRPVIHIGSTHRDDN